jgi:hypothetical protein
VWNEASLNSVGQGIDPPRGGIVAACLVIVGGLIPLCPTRSRIHRRHACWRILSDEAWGFCGAVGGADTRLCKRCDIGFHIIDMATEKRPN